MVRVGSRAPSTGRAPSVNKMRKTRDKPYKVQFESVMTKKKKLKLHDIHGSARPLNGYTYLPVGFSDLAEECKELSRRKDADVAVVSAGSRAAANDPSKLSHHIYRVGYHFRTDIFDEACNKLGYCERNGKLEKITGMGQASRFEQTMSRYGSRFDAIDVNNRSEEESNKVKKHIRELFPKIPEVDLQEIYERAWEQGARTVGNAADLSLSRQVQLATIARIRHTYTDYDHLLRVGSWREARTAVEQKCLSKLIEWRGEHENDAEELEEILRETIVIDDESDDDEDMINETNDENDSDSSLELVQQTIAPKDLRVEPNEMNSRFAAPVRRPQNKVKVLPAAIQARWQNARSERYGVKPSRPEADPTSRITVALDNQGKAPRTLRTGGVQYVRLSPETELASRPHPPQKALIPGLGSPMAANNGFCGPRPPAVRPVPQNNQHNWTAWNSNGNQPSTYPLAPELEQARTPPHMAVQSIEKPHDTAPSHNVKPTYHGAPPLIDLTTPPKPRPRTDYTNLASTKPLYDDRARQAASWNQDRARYMHGRPLSQVPAVSAVQSKPPLPRHLSGEVIDLTRARDYPAAIHERPSYPDHRATQYGQPPVLERVYHQPVYGQAAYPQMRSHKSQAPATPPRPVHGAPSILQPVPFGAPSPQRYLSNAGYYKAAHRVPDK